MIHARALHALPPLFLAACLASARGAQGTSDVPTPEAWLGRTVAADFELADWTEVAGYWRALGEASPRVVVERVGETTEGRDFLLATIASERNLARLDAIRADAARIADPRGLDAAEREALLLRAVPILFVSLGMHSTETAAAQFGLEFGHRLATSDEAPYAAAREELVVVVAPCLNPDGLDEVVSWYRETVGTPYEGTGLLRLYQLYSGHDNNRDWFMLTQNETRIVTEALYSDWFPQVYWDVHQQGTSRERFFVPPYRDPLNPNLDAGIIAGLDALGSRALFDMTSAGFTGVSTGVTYDMWWNGGNRNVPVRHNIIGLLTEAASVNLASPMFFSVDDLSAPRGLGGYAPSNRFPAPWPGGWWRIRDVVDYEHAFGASLLASLAREPRRWTENALEAAERTLARGRDSAPRGWILPPEQADPSAVARLVDTLLLGGVELHRAKEDFTADGRRWAAGSIVIHRDQPYGSHVKDLFEVQRYPEGDPPYDVAGWTLPLLLGVRRVEVMAAVEAELEPLRRSDLPESWLDPRLDGPTDLRSGDAWAAIFRRVAAGEPVTLLDGGQVAPRPAEGEDELALELPRIGVWAPWSGVMNEGWLRWVLDTWGVPYTSVRNEMLRAGELNEFLDVLVLPSASARYLDAGRTPGTVPDEFARGLDPEGAIAIEEFVRGGGRLVALERSAAWAIELFDLPLEDVTRGPESGEFSCPGSVVRALPAPSAGVWTSGLGPSVPVFFSRSSAWRIGAAEEGHEAPEALLTWAPTRALLSGWMREPAVIADEAAWVRAAHGDGDVHLFAFRPQYRGWSQAAFSLLFRALLLDDAAAGEDG